MKFSERRRKEEQALRKRFWQKKLLFVGTRQRNTDFTHTHTSTSTCMR